MEFHIARSIRNDLQVDGLLFSYTGNVVFADVAASRRLAARLNEALGSNPDPEAIVNGGALFAMGLIDELNHALIAHYRKEIDPALWSDALRWFEQHTGTRELDQLLLTFVEHFPNTTVLSGKITAAEWLRGSTEGMPNREAALEEITLLWLSNANPAFRAFKRLFDDRYLKLEEPYRQVTSILPEYIDSRPPLSPETGSLLHTLRAPMLASPDSITAQLEYIREQWPKYLGENLHRVLLAIDVVREEDIAIWLRFHPPGPDQYRHAAPGFGGEGFVGDEYIGFDDQLRSEFFTGPDGVRRRRQYDPEYQAPLVEYEAFSADQSWMPNVVLMAKSTYVWLEQLSKKYGRHIHQLDHIPDEELQLLADRGITGLWLIGLWERSVASRTIKRLRGQTDAVASAYSLKDYNIAEDLGGTTAYAHLRDRAQTLGIRLASDMVPNHMGIDSPWVIEHPDWFISRPESPYPVYQFNGPDISPDPRVEIKIEDHYYDQSDAAVVFRMRQQSNGHTRFVYHGNDGTSFAWNDTAQLDYSKAYVREHVIQTILHVARQFPIIRFDAAMVLAKRHVQRLWFPLPGVGGSIPSRAEYAISQEQFDALMPHEFWREVVDRVAAEVPGTLLLAEAFWLLESYFVRTLGMHRVYNSAFMVMLRDEENAKFRSYLKKTIEFDPDILKRYVNFMSNPDERTAIDQFGDGDKYFGTATMLATLPGLPMFGHGQIEGFTEKYGMEYKRARMEESPNEGLIGGHMHHIAPLLKKRRIFAESENFVLYDFWTDSGTVDENVFAYSNRRGNERSLILFNNRYGHTRGTIHISAAAMNKFTGRLQHTALADGLAIADDPSLILAFRDNAKGLEYLRRASDLHRHGLHFELHEYQYVVLLNWRELRATQDEPWDILCNQLGGQGVPDINHAFSRLKLQSLHLSLEQAISGDLSWLFCQQAAALAAEEEETQASASELLEPPAAGSPLEPQQTPAATEPAESATSIASHPVIPASLEPFQQAALRFFDDLAERTQLPDAYEGIHTAPAINTKTEPQEPRFTSKLRRVVSPREHFTSTLAKHIHPALRLPTQASQISTLSGTAIDTVLPGIDPDSVPLWSTVLAWLILDSIHTHRDARSLFDELGLRAPLAETFMQLGMEREEAWRAAARIRLLLWLKDDPTITISSPAFWSDPEVRWLTGVHQANEHTYLVQEPLEALLVWLQLPHLLAAASPGQAHAPAHTTSHISDEIDELLTVIHAAGYDLDRFLTAQKSGTKSEIHPEETPSASTIATSSEDAASVAHKTSSNEKVQ